MAEPERFRAATEPALIDAGRLITRLAAYEVQARFSLADIYDRASAAAPAAPTAPSAPTEPAAPAEPVAPADTTP